MRAVTWIVAALLAVGAGASSAAPVRGTFAFDHRNAPSIAPLLDRELVILSARGMLAPGRADSLLAAGAKPYLIVQPNQAWRVGGAAIGAAPGDDRTFPWDTATYELALKHDAIMPIDMFGGVSWSSMVLDFGNREFGRAYAALLVGTFPKAAGVLLDYGCPWIPVELPDWTGWRAGWVAMLHEVRRLRPDLVLISQCDQWKTDLPVDGVLLERVGSALNPPAKSFATTRALAAAGKRALYRQELAGVGLTADPAKTRRFFATAAVMFDGAFDLCADPNTPRPAHWPDLEHFTMSVGSPGVSAWERVPGVWQRQFSRGIALVNLSGVTFVYPYNKSTTFYLGPNDGLLIQYRAESGRFIKAVSNAGR